MAENIPPTSAGKTANAAASDRGLPYYEKLRRDLRDTITKKRMLDRNMAALEASIFQEETRYLEDTSSAGNIVKGFDNYIKAAATSTTSTLNSGTISGAAAGGTRRKAAVNDTDRVFSRSSVGYSKNGDGETPGGGSAVSTPGVGTPTASVAGDKGDKKKKKGAANANDDDDTRSTKRQKISFSQSRKKDED